MKFTSSGHWIYNSTLGTIFHIDGSTKNVDNQVKLPAAGPGTQVVETDKSGYVLAQGRTYEFGKSDLVVTDPKPAPVNERPVALEAAGAAFAIYRQAGRVVRLNEHPAADNVNVPLGQPVVTSTGTVWVSRPDNGQLCQLPLLADRLSCPAKVPLGHTGALTIVGNDQVVFVDTTANEMYTVDDGGIGRKVPLPVRDLSGTAIVAPNDVAGRVAIMDPQKNLLHLVDTAELLGDKPASEPVQKQLRKGKYERIASSGNGIALIDESSNTLVTLDRNGDEKGARKIPPPSKKAEVRPGDRPGLVRGNDSRLYVDSVAGEHVMVVDDGGDVTPVDTSSPRPEKSKTPKPQDPTPSKPVPSTDPTTQAPKPNDRPTNHPTQPDHKTDPTTQRPNPPDQPSGKPTTPDPKPTVRASRPGAPSSVSGKAGTGSATVTWGAAADNGAAITQYRVSWSGGSRTLAGSARSTNITGLTNGTAYTFTVRAVNRVGTGPGSSTTRLVPDGGAADAPPNLKVTAGNRKITLSWSRPNLHGGTLKGYQYTASGPGEQQSDTSMNTSHTFTGLTNGDPYLVEVQAITSDAKGNLIRGKIASRIVTVGSGGGGSAPTLTASRGASTSLPAGNESCDPPGCAYIRISGKGLQPNTAYFFQPYTTKWQPSNPGATLTTDSAGSILITDRFATDAPGQKVWVVATAGNERVESNHFTWSG
jgi:hypothetical protein